MTTEPRTPGSPTSTAAPARLNALVDRLATEHAEATRHEVVATVQSAVEAVRMFGAVDGELLSLAEQIAERDLRLRLGLERDVARLDPEPRHRD